ncbi:MAG: 2,3-dihydroxybenzoate-AMP ligase, partial [Corynebacterium variabile]|nr:2,3-dihydroxybenzoate-AMP ligase [Corynebacterium variabile]
MNHQTVLDAATDSDDPGMLATGVSREDAERYRELGAWTGDTHWALFCRAVDSWPTETAATDRHRTVTWSDLDAG